MAADHPLRILHSGGVDYEALPEVDDVGLPGHAITLFVDEVRVTWTWYQTGDHPADFRPGHVRVVELLGHLPAGVTLGDPDRPTEASARVKAMLAPLRHESGERSEVGDDGRMSWPVHLFGEGLGRSRLLKPTFYVSTAVIDRVADLQTAGRIRLVSVDFALHDLYVVRRERQDGVEAEPLWFKGVPRGYLREFNICAGDPPVVSKPVAPLPLEPAVQKALDLVSARLGVLIWIGIALLVVGMILLARH